MTDLMGDHPVDGATDLTTKVVAMPRVNRRLLVMPRKF
jgi:hypothetical protein